MKTNVQERLSPNHTMLGGGITNHHSDLRAPIGDGEVVVIKHVENMKLGYMPPHDDEPGGIMFQLINRRSLKGQFILISPAEARSMAQSLTQLADEVEDGTYERLAAELGW